MLQVKLILCPIDFSEFSVRAYHHALSLAEHYRAKLVALHIVELSQHASLGFVTSAGLYEQFSQTVLENGKRQLQEFVKHHARDEVQPEIIVRLGKAADSILMFAEARQTDLIVMGTHGRRGFDRLVLGSVTDRVMRHALCPVLAVHDPPHDSMATAEERLHVHHLNRILYCTDFSENSERALSYAISATVEYDAELTLLYVFEEALSADKMEAATAEATRKLRALIPPESCGLKIKTAVRVGKPYEQIIQLAQESQSDMLAMGVSGRGALDTAVFGSTTYRVMQLGPCPVLTVRF